MVDKAKAVPAAKEEFSEDNIPKDSWIKFAEVGNWFVGTFISKEIKPAQDVYPAQMVYTVNNVKYNGEQMPQEDEWFVGVTIREGKSNFVNNRLKKVTEGMRFGIKFEKEIKAKVKGMHNAKSLMPNVFGLDPDYTSPEDAFGAADANPGEEIDDGPELPPFKD